MSTGNLRNNLETLKRTLSNKFNIQFDDQSFNGSPVPFLRIYHYILLDWSSDFSNWLVDQGYIFFGLDDKTFLHRTWTFLRSVFRYSPTLNIDQFFTHSFLEHKVLITQAFAYLVLDQRSLLRREKEQSNRNHRIGARPARIGVDGVTVVNHVRRPDPTQNLSAIEVEDAQAPIVVVKGPFTSPGKKRKSEHEDDEEDNLFAYQRLLSPQNGDNDDDNDDDDDRPIYTILSDEELSVTTSGTGQEHEGIEQQKNTQNILQSQSHTHTVQNDIMIASLQAQIAGLVSRVDELVKENSMIRPQINELLAKNTVLEGRVRYLESQQQQRTKTQQHQTKSTFSYADGMASKFNAMNHFTHEAASSAVSRSNTGSTLDLEFTHTGSSSVVHPYHSTGLVIDDEEEVKEEVKDIRRQLADLKTPSHSTPTQDFIYQLSSKLEESTRVLKESTQRRRKTLK